MTLRANSSNTGDVHVLLDPEDNVHGTITDYEGVFVAKYHGYLIGRFRTRDAAIAAAIQWHDKLNL